MFKNGHIMVDIETGDTKSTALIRSIGACEFDLLTGKIGKKFYINIDWDSCLYAGLTVSQDTMEWWEKQSTQAKEIFNTPPPVPLEIGLLELSTWYDLLRGKPDVWYNPATFDGEILTNAYAAVGYKFFHHWSKETCLKSVLKTITALTGFKKTNIPFMGVRHNALDDAVYQATYLAAGYKQVHDKVAPKGITLRPGVL